MQSHQSYVYPKFYTSEHCSSLMSLIRSYDLLTYACSAFHLTQSWNLTPEPPKISSALPMVRSTLPLLSSFTNSKSSIERPPPAYVTGMLHHSASLVTSSWSIPRCRPSTSAAWMRNSLQWGSRRDIDSIRVCQLLF